MTEQQERWAEVGAKATAQMQRRGMSQADLIRESGVSDFTVRKVLRGEPGNYRPDRLGKIAKALGWTAESIAQILSGGEPVPASAATTPATYTFTAEQVEALFNRVHGVIARLDALESVVAELIQLSAELADDEDVPPPARRRR